MKSQGPRLFGNQFWKLRTKHGKDKIFGGDGSTLWAEACAYFDWCDRHPWERVELVKYQGIAEEADVPLGRPYTMDGLTVYLGVSSSYFRTAKSALKEKMEAKRATPDELELLSVIECIEQTVRTQQVEGAAVGVFNANLISRINGIADNVNQNTTGDTVLRVSVRDQQTADNLAELDDLL